LAYLLPLVKLLTRRKSGNKAKALIIAPTFELSIQIYKVCIKLIGKKDPFEGVRIGHLTKLVLEKKKKGETIDVEEMLKDLGRFSHGCNY
jgi:superfamily II DNA/RNA helicase